MFRKSNTAGLGLDVAAVGLLQDDAHVGVGHAVHEVEAWGWEGGRHRSPYEYDLKRMVINMSAPQTGHLRANEVPTSSTSEFDDSPYLQLNCCPAFVPLPLRSEQLSGLVGLRRRGLGCRVEWEPCNRAVIGSQLRSVLDVKQF